MKFGNNGKQFRKVALSYINRLLSERGREGDVTAENFDGRKEMLNRLFGHRIHKEDTVVTVFILAKIGLWNAKETYTVQSVSKHIAKKDNAFPVLLEYFEEAGLAYLLKSKFDFTVLDKKVKREIGRLAIEKKQNKALEENSSLLLSGG